MIDMTANETKFGTAIVHDSGIAAGSAVLTLGGVLPVEYLQPGDRVVTRGGATRLKALIPSRYSGPAYVVQGGSLGHMLPGEDSILTPGTRILIRDWRAKTIFGRDSALVAVDALADGEYVREIVATDLPMFTLVFDTEQVVYAAGLELAAHADTVADSADMADMAANGMLDAIRLARAA